MNVLIVHLRYDVNAHVVATDDLSHTQKWDQTRIDFPVLENISILAPFPIQRMQSMYRMSIDGAAREPSGRPWQLLAQPLQ